MGDFSVKKDTVRIDNGAFALGSVEIQDPTTTDKLNIDEQGVIGIKIADGRNVDAFGRLRVSDPATLFDSTLQYNTAPLLWATSTTGSATVTHLPNESSARLRCTTASGDKVIRQTKSYIRYQPGKSQRILMTGVIGAKKTNVRQRLGYFDVNNGVFFEQDSSNLKVVRRSYVSGVAVDDAVNQSAWNIDKLDGTGASGVTLDMSKAHIFVIDLQWLGSGRVRFGFSINGVIYYCHQLPLANVLTSVYMTTANLPVRYEIENTGTTASNTDMIQICCSVQSEGGFEDDKGITHSASNGISAISVTTRRPILTVRPSVTFNSITNRGIIIPLEVELYAQTNSAFYEIVYNGTLTGASFVNIGSNSIGDYDVSATTISGGEVIDSGFIVASASARGNIATSAKSKLVLCNDYDGTNPDRISVVVTSFSGTSSLSSAIMFRELY